MQTAQPPELVTTRVEDGQAPGLTYRIEGDLVPVLHRGARRQPQALLRASRRALEGSPAADRASIRWPARFKRVVAGMPIFMTETQSGRGDRLLARRPRPRPLHPPCLRAGPSTSASTSSSPPPAASTTRSPASGAWATCCSAARGFFIDRFTARAPRRASSGCTATATSSRRCSPPARRSTSRPVAGSTATRRVSMQPAGVRVEDRRLRRLRATGVQPLHRTGTRGHPVGVRAPADGELTVSPPPLPRSTREGAAPRGGSPGRPRPAPAPPRRAGTASTARRGSPSRAPAR